MKISDKTEVSMPMKNMIGIVVVVAMGVFAYTEVTARLTSLETSRELFQADLLKKSEQKPTDQEQFMLIEDINCSWSVGFCSDVCSSDLNTIFKR